MKATVPEYVKNTKLLYMSGLNMMVAILNKGYGCPQNQEAKLKIVEGVIPWSNQQEADPTSSYIRSSIVGLMLGR